ncbi:MAG: corrinoid protein [Spirochaetaceae bacterium]|jgi:5-methyltetrahydrofolate--homocysteine methyltransferase|nr:corrinoid protein [Spirochaetaceae bacterium]
MGDFSARFGEISGLLQRGKSKDVVRAVQRALDEGVPAQEILDKGLIAGMSVIGEKFKRNEVFVPEVLIAAKAMNQASAVLKPVLQKAGVKPIGKAVICTVKGDLHDIGKNLVKMMIEGNGIEVLDLGVDCGAEKVVDAIKDSGAGVVCLSALLTTTMMAQKDTIDAIQSAGMRDRVKIMVGGAPVTQSFADEIGADAYTPDAASAAEVCKGFFTGEEA